MRKIFFIAAMVVITLAACGSPPAVAIATKVNVGDKSYTNVTPALLKQMLAAKDFFFVNVHFPHEGQIAQTDAFIPYDTVEQRLDKFPADKNANIVVYCLSGSMSTIVAEKLVQLGYTNVWNLDGGMIAWENAGYLVIRDRR